MRLTKKVFLFKPQQNEDDPFHFGSSSLVPQSGIEPESNL